MSLLDIDKKNLPRHVAVIMDGNGRWAKKNALNILGSYNPSCKYLTSSKVFM